MISAIMKLLRAVLIFTVLGVSSIVFADDLQVPYISMGACPFEGCSYGEWTVLKPVAVYPRPDTKLIKVAELEPGETIYAETGNVHVMPGLARVTGKPHKSAHDLDPDKEILILDYIGEGYSRVYQDGKFYTVKIARTEKECEDRQNWRYCWVEIMREPVSYWWVFIKARNGKIAGWVLIENDAIKPIDLFEQ